MKNPFSKPAAVARHLKIAVTGKPGTGKTVFGLAARKHGLGRVAVVSNEAGDVHYIQHAEWGDFDRLPTQKLADLEEAIGFIEESPGVYGTLVIDTVTGVYESLVGAKAKDDGSVSVKDWGLIKRKWRSLMARINNLPLNIVAVVHENDIVEQNGTSSRIVGQKLDAEKTYERNPDVLVRLMGARDGKIVGVVLKDRTMTFAAGTTLNDTHVGLWAKAIKAGAVEARVSLPEEVDAANEQAISRAPEQPVPAAEAATLAGLLSEITVHEAFNAKAHADNWWRKHWDRISTLTPGEQKTVRKAIDSKIHTAKEASNAA